MGGGELCSPHIKPHHALSHSAPPRPPPPTPPLGAGILGENLVIPPFLTDSVSRFYVLNATALAMCFCFFYSIIMYMKWCKLI